VVLEELVGRLGWVCVLAHTWEGADERLAPVVGLDAALFLLRDEATRQTREGGSRRVARGRLTLYSTGSCPLNPTAIRPKSVSAGTRNEQRGVGEG